MWYKFLILFIPKVLTDIFRNLVFNILPMFLFSLAQVCNLQKIINGNDKHRIIIDVKCQVGIFIQNNPPVVFRLDITPIDSCRSP
ncbi:hypothetical protein D3C81_1523930 [compost metagenome]